MTEGLPDIRIPGDLLPEDGRLGSGPSKVPGDAVQNLVDYNLFGRSHRSSVIRDEVRRLQHGLVELFELPHGYEVVLGNGGATVFWEVAAFNLIRHHSSDHVIQGNFSEKWLTATRQTVGNSSIDTVAHNPIRSGDARLAARVEATTLRSSLGSLALTHNETSTGIVTPIVRPVTGHHRHTPQVLVDATSAAGAMEVDITQTDAYFFSPQKALASDGGLWIAILSPRALKAAADVTSNKYDQLPPPSLHLMNAIEASRKHETYNTPPMTSIVLAALQTEKLLADGDLAAAARRSKAMSDDVYRWAEASDYAEPFIKNPAERSPTTPVILLDKAINAKQVADILQYNGVFDVAGYRGVANNGTLRIGTWPAVEPDDVVKALGAIDYVVEQLTT